MKYLVMSADGCSQGASKTLKRVCGVCVGWCVGGVWNVDVSHPMKTTETQVTAMQASNKALPHEAPNPVPREIQVKNATMPKVQKLLILILPDLGLSWKLDELVRLL